MAFLHRRRQIDRRAVGSVAGLELKARQAVEGFYSGIHKSPYHGFNVEFAEYREYVPGDDLRYLDWRVLARSDKRFIKQFEAETNLNAYMLVDCSGSMDFGTGKTLRLDYAASIAAALTLLLLGQGDAVGLVTFDNQVRSFIPPRGNARHFGVIVDALEGIQPGADTNISGVLHEIAERIHRRSLIVILSDFFDDVEALLKGLQHFRHRHHEVIVFHLLDDAEIEFPFDRMTLFEGIERGERVVVDPQALAEGYRARFREYLDRLKQGCSEKGISYDMMRLSEPFEKSLSAFLGRRRARSG